MNRLTLILFAALSSINVFASQNNASLTSNSAAMKEFGCVECKRVFESARGLRNHVSWIHTVATVRCGMCLTVCTSQAALRAHKHRRHKKDSILGIDFISRKKIIIGDGSKDQEMVSKPSFSCDECADKFFSNKESLRQHKSAKHGIIPGALEAGEKVYCLDPGCGKAGKAYSIKGLKSHQRFHKEATFQCDNCNKLYRSKKSLFNHRPGCKDQNSAELPAQVSFRNNPAFFLGKMLKNEEGADESLLMLNVTDFLPEPDGDIEQMLEIPCDKIFLEDSLHVDRTEFGEFLKN